MIAVLAVVFVAAAAASAATSWGIGIGGGGASIVIGNAYPYYYPYTYYPYSYYPYYYPYRSSFFFGIPFGDRDDHRHFRDRDDFGRWGGHGVDRWRHR